MTLRLLVTVGTVLATLTLPARPAGAGATLPVKNGRPIVATVNGDTIALDELVIQLEPPVDTARLRQGRATAVEQRLLERLVVVRLIVQEAATMGLSTLPEITKQVGVESRQILREVLMQQVVKDVVPDEAAIEKAFRTLAREWKTASLLFTDEATAKAARHAMTTGGHFDQVAAAVLDGKKGRAERADAYHKAKELLPEVARALEGLDVGQVSPVVRTPTGFVVIQVVDIRYPESAEARAEAWRTVASQQHQAALQAYEDRLRARDVVIDRAVLDSVNFEAKQPGLAGLSKDTRVVARIKGASPVTVADLTEYLRLQFFHGGGDDRGQLRRMNEKKATALEATLGRRVMNVEAQRLGLDKSPAYRDRVRAFEDSLVFDTFVQKVIAPQSRLREEEVKAHYDGHLASYSYPAMVRLRTLAFSKRGSAEAATERLRAGTDFGWLAANAEDQIGADARTLSVPDGRLLTVDSLPEGVRKALGTVRRGDVRLHAAGGNQYYVFSVQDVVDPGPRPFAEVKSEIARTLHAERLKKGVEDYGARLRALSKVAVFLEPLP